MIQHHFFIENFYQILHFDAHFHIADLDVGRIHGNNIGRVDDILVRQFIFKIYTRFEPIQKVLQ